MTQTARSIEEPRELFLLGDEAVARAALDAGISAAYGYPGTPSTEAFEYLSRNAEGRRATWCTNEKVAVESALGVSLVGRRSLVVMKHVGLNVAADAFINAALVSIRGGLVVAVADDPGMHSSQNEQDSRFYADFAHVVCLEPADHQEAYDMTREAFVLSERFHIPVLVRLVTRLAHSRGSFAVRPVEPERALRGADEPRDWILLPPNARRLWGDLLAAQAEMTAANEASPFNRLAEGDPASRLGVVTTGMARAYYAECLHELKVRPHHLHIGAYPLPGELVRQLCGRVDRLLVLEEGYPYLERLLVGLLPPPLEIAGKLSGQVPRTGELTPDIVRRAFDLPARRGLQVEPWELPPRPPQLCQACPHRDSFAALRLALASCEDYVVTGDIGCYTLGALPPYQMLDSCVCMGAALGMARGAAEVGAEHVVAVLGDSTFLHSGIPPLLDAIHDDTDLTLLILDNGAVAMTGAQEPRVPSSRIGPLLLGLGVDPAHCHVVAAHPQKVDEMASLMRAEIEHHGLSVVVTVRECIEHARMRKARAKRAQVPTQGGRS
jgi:indolepyruvate ferredoxin oxidoreductase alpha subunit